MLQVRQLRAWHKEAGLVLGELCAVMGAFMLAMLLVQLWGIVHSSSDTVEELQHGRRWSAVRHALTWAHLSLTPLLVMYASSRAANQVSSAIARNTLLAGYADYVTTLATLTGAFFTITQPSAPGGYVSRPLHMLGISVHFKRFQKCTE